MLIGVGIGVLGGTNVGPISPTMVVVAAVAVFSFMLFCIRAKDNLYGFLPVMPLVLAGLLFLPFFDEGSRALSKIASSVIWLVWIFLSSFQLSCLKETFGLSETRLCFSDEGGRFDGVAGRHGRWAGPLVACAGLIRLRCLWCMRRSVRHVLKFPNRVQREGGRACRAAYPSSRGAFRHDI